MLGAPHSATVHLFPPSRPALPPASASASRRRVGPSLVARTLTVTLTAHGPARLPRRLALESFVLYSPASAPSRLTLLSRLRPRPSALRTMHASRHCLLDPFVPLPYLATKPSPALPPYSAHRFFGIRHAPPLSGTAVHTTLLLANDSPPSFLSLPPRRCRFAISHRTGPLPSDASPRSFPPRHCVHIPAPDAIASASLRTPGGRALPLRTR